MSYTIRTKYITHISLALILISIGFYAEAQTVQVKANGVWEIANITIEKAKTLAIEKAKEDALRAAGISEEFIVINTSSISDKITRFTSSSNSELLGEITNYEILKGEVRDQDNRHFYFVEINATVKKGKVKKDFEFDVYVTDIKKTAYKDGENFNFSITPTKDCFVNIFWINDFGKGAQVYPNQAEPMIKLLANETYSFPRTQNYKTRKEKKEPTEIVSLIFVFTKKNIAFTHECTLDNIQQWTMSIPSEIRLIKYDTIVVTD